jgi:hypothetical protein
VHTVQTYGAFLTDRWRRRLSSTFGSRIVNSYGVSEVIAGVAAECEACGWFHFPPTVIAEVIDPFSPSRLIPEGYGELVLTALLPFNAYQPMIRFRTGDIVRVQQATCGMGRTSISPVGRTRRSIIDPGSGAVLPSSLVYEIVDDLPDAARNPYFSLDVFGLAPVFGFPRFTVERIGERPFRVRLEVELSYPPDQFRERGAEIAELLRARCAGAVGNLFGRIDFERPIFDVRLAPPGALAHLDKRAVKP